MLNLHKIRLDAQTAAKYGREVTKISKRDGIMTGTVPDTKYGEVKSYHIDVLDEVFADLIYYYLFTDSWLNSRVTFSKNLP